MTGIGTTAGARPGTAAPGAPGAVLAPLNSAGALPRYAEAGVGEVYVGFHDERWDLRFGADLNRMSGFGAEANPFDFPQMLGQLEEARTLGLRAFVCFNASGYSADQAAYIAREYLPGIAGAGAAGVIVSGRALMPALAEAGMPSVVSTVAGVFNARLAAYYRDCGARRVILPRDLSLVEIQDIVSAVPQVEYEVFLMRNGCMFADSHCLGRHCAGKPSLCLSLREGRYDIRQVAPPPDGGDGDALVERAWLTENLWNGRFHRRTCGLCALWRFEQLGIAAYKVVGRGDDLEDLLADARLVGHNAAIARECATEGDYHARMARPRFPESLCGELGLSCYYPEAARYMT